MENRHPTQNLIPCRYLWRTWADAREDTAGIDAKVLDNQFDSTYSEVGAGGFLDPVKCPHLSCAGTVFQGVWSVRNVPVVRNVPNTGTELISCCVCFFISLLIFIKKY